MSLSGVRFTAAHGELPQSWSSLHQSKWGDEPFPYDEWFDEGDALEFSELELTIEEPDHWERALHWFRSLVIATGLLPA